MATKQEPLPVGWREMIKQHGWMVPGLLRCDEMTHGRWGHWYDCMEAGKIVGDSIPQVEWSRTPEAAKVWEKMLDATSPYGDWRGWSSWRNVDFLFNWLLFGLGHKGTPKPQPEDDLEFKGASERILNAMNLGILLRDPHDYIGDILAENQHGRHVGFFPTPIEVSQLIAMMTMEGDCRAQTVCDPCVGTGRMLLAASNYSYRLYGMDIDGTVIKATLINGYLYAPWLVKPFPFLDGNHTQPEASLRVSDAIAEQAHVEGTVSDNQAWRFEPIKKRVKQGQPSVEQGVMLLAEENR